MKHPYLAVLAVTVFSLGFGGLVAAFVAYDASLGHVIVSLVILAAGIVFAYVWHKSY